MGSKTKWREREREREMSEYMSERGQSVGNNVILMGGFWLSCESQPMHINQAETQVWFITTANCHISQALIRNSHGLYIYIHIISYNTRELYNILYIRWEFVYMYIQIYILYIRVHIGVCDLRIEAKQLYSNKLEPCVRY